MQADLPVEKRPLPITALGRCERRPNARVRKIDSGRRGKAHDAARHRPGMRTCTSPRLRYSARTLSMFTTAPPLTKIQMAFTSLKLAIAQGAPFPVRAPRSNETVAVVFAF